MDQALSLKRKTVEQILVEPIDDEGDPLLLYGLHSEEQQHSFATTCGNSPVPKPVTSLKCPVRFHFAIAASPTSARLRCPARTRAHVSVGVRKR